VNGILYVLRRRELTQIRIRKTEKNMFNRKWLEPNIINFSSIVNWDLKKIDFWDKVNAVFEINL